MKILDASTGAPWCPSPMEHGMHHNTCMWDLHPYSTERLGYPVSILVNEIKLKGNFCSFPCMRSFLRHRAGLCGLETFDDVNKLQNMHIFADAQKNVAPARELLITFEGNMTIDMFRSTDAVHVIEIPKEEISVIGVHHATCKDDISGEKNFSRKPFSSDQATEMIKQKLKEPKKNLKEKPTILENFMCISKRKLPHAHMLPIKKSKHS